MQILIPPSSAPTGTSPLKSRERTAVSSRVFQCICAISRKYRSIRIPLQDTMDTGTTRLHTGDSGWQAEVNTDGRASQASSVPTYTNKWVGLTNRPAGATCTYSFECFVTCACFLEHRASGTARLALGGGVRVCRSVGTSRLASNHLQHRSCCVARQQHLRPHRTWPTNERAGLPHALGRTSRPHLLQGCRRELRRRWAKFDVALRLSYICAFMYSHRRILLLLIPPFIHSDDGTHKSYFQSVIGRTLC